MKLPTFLAATFVACGVITAPAAKPLVNYVSEKAPFVFSVHDMPGVLKNWETSPWLKTWQDAQVQKFLAPLREGPEFAKFADDFKRETGMTISEVLHLAEGDALIALTDLNFSPEEKDATKIPMLFSVDVGSNAGKLEKLIAEQEAKETAKVSHATEEFMGVSIHTATRTSDGVEESHWAIVDGVFVVTPNKATIQSFVNNVKEGGVESAFGQSPRFLSMQQQGGDGPQLRFVVNFSAVIPWVQEMIAAKAAGEQANPFFDPRAILPALGVDAWQDLYLNVTFGDEQAAMSGGLTYTEERGLAKLLAYREGPVPQPGFVSADWVTVNSAKFSVSDAFAALEEMIGAYNPAVLGMGQMYLQQFNQQLGIDIKRDFFGSFGTDMISAYARRPGAGENVSLEDMDQFFAVSLDNVQGFNTALGAFLKLAGPRADQMITKREYLGQTINTIPMPAMQPGKEPRSFSYAVAKNYLLVSVGTPAAIETAIQGLGGKGRSFWARPEVKRALALAPSGACTFSYQDTATVLAGVCEMFADLSEQTRNLPAVDMPEDAEGDAMPAPAKPQTIPVDPAAKPDAAVFAKYWADAYGFGTRDRNGIYFKSILPYKK